MFIPYPLAMTVTLEILSTCLTPSTYSSCLLLWIYPLFSRGLMLFLGIGQSLFDCVIALLKNIPCLPKRSQAIKVLPPFLLTLNSHYPTPHHNVLLQMNHPPCPFYFFVFSMLFLLSEPASISHLHLWKS